MTCPKGSYIIAHFTFEPPVFFLLAWKNKKGNAQMLLDVLSRAVCYCSNWIKLHIIL